MTHSVLDVLCSRLLGSRRWLLCALALAILVGPVLAQNCVIGVYADAAGEYSGLPVQPLGQLFDVYVVLHAESTAAGAAYQLYVPYQLVVFPVSFGPSGDGLRIAGDYGDWVGFGECAIGFGGQAVVVAHYQAAILVEERASYLIEMRANPLEHPLRPVMADCANQIFPCVARHLFVYDPVATSTKSFGGVKALYGN